MFRFQEKVTGYGVAGGKINGVLTGQDRYSAPIVVLASGADAAHHKVRFGRDHRGSMTEALK